MKLSFKEALKKNIKSHTLIETMVAFIIKKAGYANYYLYGLISMHKTYEKLCKKYQKQIRDIEIQKYDCKDMSDTIFICWLQGIDNAPELVKNCFNSVKYHCKDKNIVVIDDKNYKEYTSLPDYIINKWNDGIISNTFFSDILRINILARHGGLWLDATTYLTAPLPDYIFSNEFFVYRNGFFELDDINMASWLIYSKPNNLLLLKTQALIFKYWTEHNYLRQYFLFHLFFKMVSDTYPDEYKKIPYYNHIDNHIFAEELFDEYDEKRFNQIKDITSIHKLSNKLEMSKNQENSYYSKLGELYMQ